MKTLNGTQAKRWNQEALPFKLIKYVLSLTINKELPHRICFQLRLIFKGKKKSTVIKKTLNHIQSPHSIPERRISSTIKSKNSTRKIELKINLIDLLEILTTIRMMTNLKVMILTPTTKRDPRRSPKKRRRRVVNELKNTYNFIQKINIYFYI